MEPHRAVKEFLERTLQEGRMSHAYLFLGEEGIGKKEVALWYEKQLNPTEGKTRFYLLLTELGEGKKKILIEQIQSIRRWLMLGTGSKHRVVIINPAEAMTPDAQNALLKTLEEPTPGVVFILLVQQLEGLKETILSRCQILRFRKMDYKEEWNWLRKEKGLTAQEIEKIIFLGEGKIRKIKFWLEHQKEIPAEIQFRQEVESLIGGDLKIRLNWMEKNFAKMDLEKFLYSALGLYHRLLLQQAEGREKDSFFSSAAHYSWLELFNILSSLRGARDLLRSTNVNKKLIFNQLFINL